MGNTKKVKIKVPDKAGCFSAIKRLLLFSALKSAIGYLGMSFVFAVLWHYSWPNPDGSNSFEFIGIVIFCFWVTALYIVVNSLIEVRRYKRKNYDFIRSMYIKLVETGDIQPVISN